MQMSCVVKPRLVSKRNRKKIFKAEKGTIAWLCCKNI